MHFKDEFRQKTVTMQKAVAAADTRAVELDEPFTINHGYDPINLADGDPDVMVIIARDQSPKLYKYAMLDTGSELSHVGQGKVFPIKGSEGINSFLYTVYASLKSISPHSINGRLCVRYGFLTRRDAIQSDRHLMVCFGVTDPALVELGRSLTEAAELDFPPPTQIGRAAWGVMTRRLRRFDVQWQLIAVDNPALVALRSWARTTPLKELHNQSTLLREVAA